MGGEGRGGEGSEGLEMVGEDSVRRRGRERGERGLGLEARMRRRKGSEGGKEKRGEGKCGRV